AWDPPPSASGRGAPRRGRPRRASSQRGGSAVRGLGAALLDAREGAQPTAVQQVERHLVVVEGHAAARARRPVPAGGRRGEGVAVPVLEAPRLPVGARLEEQLVAVASDADRAEVVVLVGVYQLVERPRLLR